MKTIDKYLKFKEMYQEYVVIYCKYYVRYMDDFIIFDYDKERLKIIRKEIEEKLKEFKLELNKKTNIYDLKQGFGFLVLSFLIKRQKINNKN